MNLRCSLYAVVHLYAPPVTGCSADGEGRDQRFGERLRLSGRYDAAVLADDPARVPDIGGDAGIAAGHGLPNDIGETFTPAGRQRQNVYRGHPVGDILLMAAGGEPVGGQAGVARGGWVRSGILVPVTRRDGRGVGTEVGGK